MWSFRNLSIRRKQMLIIMLTTGLALLLACLAFAAYEVFAFRKAMVQNLSTLAEIVGNNTSAALDFNDAKAAAETLSALKGEPGIIGACIYTKSGEVFASYDRESDKSVFAPPPLQPEGHSFQRQRLVLFHPIVQKGETTGVLYLESDMAGLTARLTRYAGIVGLVFLASLLLAFLLSSRLQRLVSDPILHLAQIARSVALEKNYSVRAANQGGDELGQLIGGFNEMLDQIQHRDEALQTARDQLEQRVQSRTKELAAERDLLSALMDSSSERIYFKDTQSRFLRCSKAMLECFGVQTLDQVMGKTDFDFFGEQHAQPAYDDEQDIIRTGKPMVGKVEREVWKDRQDSWVLTTKWPLFDKNNRIIGTFGISKDITAIKEAEAKLEEVHKQLLETSRQAGMAEVATSVLHNVGNVLNSINVSSSLVVDSIKKSRMGNLGRVAALIEEHLNDLATFLTTDPKGMQLPRYLIQLVEHLSSEQSVLLKEMESTRHHIEHIKDIVAMQQTYAKVCGVKEKVKATDLVEDALRMNIGALARHEVQVARDYPAEVPELNVERHKVLQILVNLVRNAKYACDEAARKDKLVTIRVRTQGNRLCIAVIDNGVGIPPENMTRIFNHGFTTRKDGHGFGLHSGALAAKEIGGALTAQSEGRGKGATFTLELPLQHGIEEEFED